ncbi:MAG: cytochrome c biogenesis protein CcsA [Chloroflexi bacterium]|nr:cytochrome c biogenesis protein CcsA [Chloroflexota bacterium]
MDRRLPFGWLAAVAVAISTVVGLFIVPADAAQGDAQRIMYVHVPSAWLAYAAFFVTLVGSLLYLVRRDLRFDRVAAASAEIGLVFTGLTIVTGAIWGKATWGKWWDWDPRLTTTAILFVIYAGYLLLRQSIVERRRRARLAAVFGIIGFLNVPVVHFSVLWWRGLHQAPTIVRPGDPTIDHLLLIELLASVVAFTLVYVWLLRGRIDLERSHDDAELQLEPAP